MKMNPTHRGTYTGQPATLYVVMETTRGRKLLSLQNAEGYWVNSVADEMQDNKVLVTSFTMSALHAILQ